MVNSRLPNRQSIRLQGYDYSQAGAYFITICTQNRLHLFGRIVDGEMILNDAGKIIFDQWMCLSQRFHTIELHECVVMPNHIHGIIEITNAADTVGVGLVPTRDKNATERATTRVTPTVGYIVGAYKSLTTTRYIDGVKQLGWQRFNKKIWQRNYWEHIVRDEKEYHRIAQYIIANPLKWEMDKLNHDCSGNQVMESAVEYNHEVWMI